MQKLLIIPSWQVWPLHTGGAHAQTFGINELSKEMEVHIILTEHNIDQIESFKSRFPLLKIHYFKQDTISKKNQLQNFINKLNYKLNPPYNKNQTEKILEIISNRLLSLNTVNFYISNKVKDLDEKYQFDFIQYEMDFNIPLIFDYTPKGKSILVLHEVTSTIVEQNLNLLGINKTYANSLVKTFKNFESNNLPLFDKIVVFNEFDKLYLLQHCPNLKIDISPYTIPQPKNIFNPSIDQFGLIFLGGGHHYPNFQGLNWFFDNVWQHLIKNKDVKLYITGKWQFSFRKQYASDHVNFVGKVDNTQLNKLLVSNILINPIFIGSGLRTKILEAISTGIPIVSTSLEKKLIPQLAHDENISFADDPDSFYSETIRLLNNTELVKKYSSNAINLYKKHLIIEKLFPLRYKVYQF